MEINLLILKAKREIWRNAYLAIQGFSAVSGLGFQWDLVDVETLDLFMYLFIFA